MRSIFTFHLPDDVDGVFDKNMLRTIHFHREEIFAFALERGEDFCF